MILLAFDHQNSGVAQAWEALRAGASALDAIEIGIRAVEANPEEHSVGYSGYPNAAGTVELDAAVMDGDTRATGAVGALQGFLHPVSIARQVMERLPHVLLVGEGAARFAGEVGAERAELLTDYARDYWQRWLKTHGLDGADLDTAPLADAVWASMDPVKEKGTTVYLAQDAAGRIAAATSTSGWFLKYPGRIGDSPIVGAGLYADTRYGAAACIGMGELSIRTSAAHATVLYMKTGMSVEEAAREAMNDVATLPDWKSGGLMLHAIDAAGGSFVISAFKPKREKIADYHLAVGDQAAPECREAYCLDV